MKKKIVVAIIICLAIIFIIGAIISATKFNVLNPISELCGIAQIYWTDNKLAVVQNFPEKVVFFMREDGKNYFDEYMNELGGYIEIPNSADAGDKVYTNGDKEIYVHVAGSRFARYTLTELGDGNIYDNADMETFMIFDNIVKYQEECPYKSNISIKVDGENKEFYVVPIKIDNRFYNTMTTKDLANSIERTNQTRIPEDAEIEIQTDMQFISKIFNFENGMENKISKITETQDDIVRLKSLGKGVYFVEIMDDNWDTTLNVVFM